MTTASLLNPSAPAQAGLRAVQVTGTGGARRVAMAYDACREITRSRARNFYYGLRLTPEPRRSALYSVYAWMRAADDEADGEAGDDGRGGGSGGGVGDGVEARRSRLALHRERTTLVLAGEADVGTGHAGCFWPAFAATAAAYPLDASIFADTLDGLEEDLDHAGYATDAQLARYCYRVAGTVGLACVSIWGARRGADAERVRELALRRGQAFQRTNILRDFAEDFDASPRRVYIPSEAFARFGLTGAALRAWSDPTLCGALVLDQARRARLEYEGSAALEGMIDPACAPTLWAMTRIYEGLLRQIERDPARVVSPVRVRLSAPHKASIALAATLRARMGRRPGRPDA